MIAPFSFDDPDQYLHGTPHQEFARLRRDAPFAWHPSVAIPGTGYWLATRHRDIVAISRAPEQFSTSAPHLTEPLPPQFWPDFPALAMIANNLLTYDSSKHPLFRAAAAAPFSAPRLARREQEIREVCARILDLTYSRSSFDFAEEVSVAIPVAVVLGLFLRIPQEDWAKVSGLVETLNAIDDPSYKERPAIFLQAAQDLLEYGLSRVRDAKEATDGSILAEIIRHPALKDISPEEAFFSYWFPVLAGSFDTLAGSICGGVKALFDFPLQFQRLIADRGLIPSAVEEMLRWTSPVIYFRRTAVRDTVFADRHIKQGQPILLCFPSANRDEQIFERPDEFDVGRNPNPQIALGHGPHFCMGARMGSLVMRIFLEEFVSRGATLCLDGDVTHTRSGFLNRISTMPVRRCSEIRPASFGGTRSDK